MAEHRINAIPANVNLLVHNDEIREARHRWERFLVRPKHIPVGTSCINPHLEYLIFRIITPTQPVSYPRCR
ncbi:hypothetical protein SAMN05192554_13322 [Haloarchaeobius iranensis]|uniref:Uncharacterized protein n=1 Tax=Haloarchaeobius iranensis TaxID=996166 RepID=A0A1H0B4A0_9EURY|nr:hypothetical protein SAMN05192554_13322 [Haloarchaeobius iranensis]